jgi:hypothetical protein
VALYERRLFHEEGPAVIDRRYNQATRRRPDARSRRTRGDVKSPPHRVAAPVARTKNRGPAKQVRATVAI